MHHKLSAASRTAGITPTWVDASNAASEAAEGRAQHLEILPNQAIE